MALSAVKPPLISRNILTALPGRCRMIPNSPPSLVRYLREGRCVLFCGSGLSAWAKLPTWTTLLEEIVGELSAELPDDADAAELNRLLKAGKLLEVADHCKEKLGRRYNDILSERLRGATGEIPEPHKVIVQLPFSGIITTNYDKLLERSYASVGSTPKTPTHTDTETLGPLLFDQSFFILKAHGDIDRPESMVLTTRDYQEIIHANPAFNSIFSAILLTKAVLFVGYSINDPDFRLLLDRQLTVFRGSIPERYALMSGVGRVEREVLWRTARIRVLSYDEGKHEQVLEFLRGLLAQVATPMQPATSSPALTDGKKPTSRASGRAAKEAPRRKIDASDRGVSSDASPLTVTAAPGATLSIRMKGQALEASVSSDGTSVQAAGTPPQWPRLTLLLRQVAAGDAPARLVAEELSRCVPMAILKALAETDGTRVITLRLSPEVELLPWEWLIVDGTFLMVRNSIVRAPFGVTDSARGYPMVQQPPRILLIGDPTQKDGAPLPGALEETNRIAVAYRGQIGVEPTVLIGPEANFDRLVTEFSTTQYDVVHFAGHAWFDELEPFLLLSGHAKLRSSELRSLLSPRPPAILFLNSHFTFFTPPGASAVFGSSAGYDAEKPNVQGQRGFIEAATTAGVGALIGCFAGALDDATAKDVGIRFHESLLRGAPVVQALHLAVVSGDPGRTEENASRLSYAISGYGDIALQMRATPIKPTRRPSVKRAH